MPVTIISDGCLISENLTLAQKDAAWVQKVLLAHHATLEQTWLLTVDKSDRILWLPREDCL